MALYLVRHAEAKSKEEDPERSLTDEGSKNINKIATYVKEKVGIEIDIIYHSGKRRAEQTAGILAKF